MRKRVSVVIRLFVMLVMALGLATLMSSSAAAQESVNCQTIIDGVIDQADCTVEVDGDGQCQVVVNGQIQQNIVCDPEGCPQQFINDDGDIFQFQCSGFTQPTVTATPPTVTATPPTVTATPPTVTATPVTPGVTVTPTPVTPGATQTPVTPDDGGQANPPDEDEEMEVSVLPDTGQGPDSGQSNSANMLLLGAMGAVLTLGAVAMRMRGNR